MSATTNRLRTTAVIVWQRFGPYHVARVRGAAQAVAGSGWTILGMEVAGSDAYSWEQPKLQGCEQRTLFPASSYEKLAPAAIRRAVTRMLDDIRPAAVVANGWSVPEAVAALRWARRAGARAVLMSETFDSSTNPVKQAIKRWRIGGCDAAIVGGRLHKRYLEDLGFDRSRIQLGYDVVDNDHFAVPALKPPPWADLARPCRYFFANTRFLERKGVDALLRSYALYRGALHSGEESWKLVISGSGEMERDWKRLASSLALDRHVLWPGFLQYDELPAAYQHAGAFVHPARREAWGLVVNEAASAGLPLVVGRRVGAACELVRHGRNGFLVEPEDVGGFAASLLRMTRFPDSHRHAMGAASRSLVSAFGPARFGEAVRRSLGLDASN